MANGFDAGPTCAPDFRVLFEGCPGRYLVLAPDFQIIAVSDAYAQATMTKRNDIVGRGLFDVFPDNPDDPAAEGVRNLKASLGRVCRTLQLDTMPVQKYDVRRPDGTFEARYWSPTNYPITDEHGALRYILHAADDVTALIRREIEHANAIAKVPVASEDDSEVAVRAREIAAASRELKETNAELGRLYEQTKELEQLKSQFFANVSHELRTPLALIMGPAQKLLGAPGLHVAHRRDLEVILRNARLLLKHVNDLLDASKLDAGKLGLEYTSLDVAELVRLAAANFESFAAERNVKFVVEVPPALIGELDADKAQRILVNLLSNAFKFTPRGGTVRCSLQRTMDDNRVRIEVADSGPGVAPEHRAAVFERFRQLEGGSTRRFGGTGLGLSIAHDFIALHGGAVSVGQAEEGGASFVIELPLRAPTGTPVRSAHDRESLAEHARVALDALRPADVDRAVARDDDPAKPLVLVIEDSGDMSRFLCDVLGADYRVETAFDGVEGLRKVFDLRPDLVLTDMMMPGLSGADLVKEVRAHNELDSTPIVMLTARGDDDLRVQMLREGANDFLLKPFSSEEMRARVGNLIAGRIAGQDNLRLIQELRESESVIRRAKEGADAANRELEAFSYSVAHDLRAPLRSIDGFSQALLEDYAPVLDDEGRKYLRMVRSSAQQMAQLIDDLLMLSRVTRNELRREPVDLGALVDASIARVRASQAGRDVDLVVAPDLGRCLGDARLLGVVFDNLLGNAWKFSGKVEHPRVEVGVRQEDRHRVYFVRDNGAGFDMSYASKLFGVFQRLHAASEFDGTGVGLAIVQRVVRRHGGRVWAEGRVGEGATFHFTLDEGNEP